jgi:cytochrome P450
MRKDRLAQVSSLVQREIDRLLDEVAAQTTATVDLVPSFLEPLPVNVICAVLGLPEDSRARLRAASVLMVSAFEKIQTPAEALASQEASRELEDYFTDLASASGATEESGALFDLVRQSPETLSPEEVVANSVLLFNGGTGAVINALGSGLVSLLSQGTQGRLIPSHGDSSILVAVEEMLRHETPIQLFERVAAEDIEFNGVQIARGERLALLLGGANRDPHVFHDPDQFDIRRDPNPHLAFSAGAHFCLGAPLARLEMQLALASILERFPGIMLAKEPVRSPGFVVRGYDSIAVTLNA